MKIVVSSEAEGLDAPVDPRFGRCAFLTLVDTGSMTANSAPNASAMATGGAGIAAAQAVARKGAEAVITGSVGPNAFQTLSAAGIKVFTGARGTVREAVEMYLRGELEEASTPNAAGHAGMGRGLGRGSGRRKGGN
ncbi:MAG: NifB/NifX family molybdenum-iron cluster-binding protein [Thermoplasmata archaeon]|nr:NifB/NifX family molybdenum-iron cluster-binding protein [Thermoplasmata archaeon]